MTPKSTANIDAQAAEDEDQIVITRWVFPEGAPRSWVWWGSYEAALAGAGAPPRGTTREDC